MQIFEILESEHDRILEMLDVLDVVCSSSVTPNPELVGDLEKIARFLRRFADACHHAKEENVLFPALESAGMPRDGGPIGVMLREHVQGRGLVATMTQTAEEARGTDATRAIEDFRDAGRQFSMLLRNHIEKENEVLFQMGRRLLAPGDEAELLRGFATHESAELPADEKTGLLETLRDLHARYL